MIAWSCSKLLKLKAGTANRLIHIGKPIEMDDEQFRQQLERLDKACKAEVSNIKDIVAEIVQTYKQKLEV